jgi:ABC-type transport system involved in cytochrome c biogenesis permease subunit
MMAIAAPVAIGGWLLASGAYAFGRKKPWIGDVFAMLGVLAAALFLATLWTQLGRPPLRTLGETRWWYATLVPTLGLLIGWRFQTRAMAIPACLMGAMFAWINLANPDHLDKTLMPALQSPWFVPHVVVYMLAYSALGLSSILGIWALGKSVITKQPISQEDTDVPHRMVLIGFPLLTCGLLFGAIWAKQAWGHYWAWDPKETWALLTWGAYLIYLHIRLKNVMKPKVTLGILTLGFAVLMACWFGINLMPISGDSVHTYTRTAD